MVVQLLRFEKGFVVKNATILKYSLVGWLHNNMTIGSHDERVINQLTGVNFYHTSQIERANCILSFLSTLIE